MLDWPTVAIRLALYLVLTVLFGLSAFSLYGLRLGEREDAIALRPWLSGSAVLGLLLSAAGLILMASSTGQNGDPAIDEAMRIRPAAESSNPSTALPESQGRRAIASSRSPSLRP